MSRDAFLEFTGFSDLDGQFPVEAQPEWMQRLNRLDLFTVAPVLGCRVERAVRSERGLRCSCPACQPWTPSETSTSGRGRRARSMVQVIGREAGQDRWVCLACGRGHDVLDFVAFETEECRYQLLTKQAKANVRALALELIWMLEGVQATESGVERVSVSAEDAARQAAPSGPVRVRFPFWQGSGP